jgi:SAM-dependent methyltransferase
MYASGVYREDDGKRFLRPFEVMVGQFRTIAANRIHALAPAGRLLDIGCGRGHFLYLMKKKGWDVSGTELCPDLARGIEAAYDIRVTTHPDLPDASVDLITMNHVFEHLSSPIEFLSECSRMLKPGGLLVIAVPNYDSWQSRFGGKGWFHLDVPHHLFHFGASGLKSLMKRSGFEVRQVRNLDIEQGVFGWLQTMLNRFGFAHNALYMLLRRQPVSDDGFSRFASLLLSPILIPFAAVLTLVEAWSGNGAVVELVCRCQKK